MVKTTENNHAIDFSVESFRENGYALIRGAFDSHEIEELRKNAFASADHKGDLLSNPLLRDFVLDERVLAIARKILGDNVVYFGDSNFLLGEKSHGYHKDNADREDPKAPDWQSDYTIIRFGLYLQDHSRHSGGLNVRPRSHNIPNAQEGKNIYLRTRVGDLVVWSLRTSHSGSGRLLRLFPSVYLDPSRADRLPAFFFAPLQGERGALFCTYGADDNHLRRYLAYAQTRKYMVERWKHSEYTTDLLEVARAKNVIVRHLWSEIEGNVGVGINDGYVAIPY
jgi:hypothetical protein